jgi:hypothetical protein
MVRYQQERLEDGARKALFLGAFCGDQWFL